MTVAVGRRRAGPRVIAAALIVAVLVSLGGLILWCEDVAYAISQEGGLLEIVQVALFGATGVFALSAAQSLRRTGRPAILEAVVAAVMVGLVIGEVDLDRQLFGIKVIHTRFFVNAGIPIVVRALAALVVVGVPAALVIYVFVRRRALWNAVGRALREPWGQVLASGVLIFAAAELFEKPLAGLRFAPRNSLEEGLELAAAIAFFIGLVARLWTLRVPPDRPRSSSEDQ